MRDGDTIISVEQQSASAKFGGVQVIRFGPGRKLLGVGLAATASVGDDNVWQLRDMNETRFGDTGTESVKLTREEVRTTLSPEFLGLAVAEPDAMGFRELRSYAEHLRNNDLESTRYEVAFWARVARLAALALVVILALPFALGPMRSSGQGARTVIGILIGAAFMVLSQTLENGGQLVALTPWLIGWIPTFALAALTGVLLWRTR